MTHPWIDKEGLDLLDHLVGWRALANEPRRRTPMRLLKDDPSGDKHNGDPKDWSPGMYRSLRDGHVVVVVNGAAISFTETGASRPSPPLYDGYIRLPEGEQIRIEA